MRTMIVFFIALLAIPVVQVASGPFERSGAPLVVDRNNTIIMTFGKSLLTRDREDPTGPR